VILPQPKAKGTNTRSPKAKPVLGDSDGGKLGDRRLSRGEAYQVAQSRGYTGNISNLSRDIDAAGQAGLFGLTMIPSGERGKGGPARNYIEVVKG